MVVLHIGIVSTYINTDVITGPFSTTCAVCNRGVCELVAQWSDHKQLMPETQGWFLANASLSHSSTYLVLLEQIDMVVLSFTHIPLSLSLMCI